MNASKQAKFHKWLEENGAQVLMATNPYELARFIAHGGTHIVYVNGKGKVSASGFSLDALNAFEHGKYLDMGFAKTARNNTAKYKAVLLKRDGRECFYCGLEMSNDDITLEHLIALTNGGNNRIENMALCHFECNQKAGSLSLVAKIRLRDKIRNEIRKG